MSHASEMRKQLKEAEIEAVAALRDILTGGKASSARVQAAMMLLSKYGYPGYGFAPSVRDDEEEEE